MVDVHKRKFVSMEFEIVNLEQLNNIVNSVMSNVGPEDYYLQTAIGAMFSAGLRSNEATNIGLHKILTEHSVAIYQQKTKAFRIVPREYFTDNFINLLSASPRLPRLSSERQLRYFVNRCFGNFQLQVDNKMLSTHIFRYAFIRNLQSQGQEIENIQLLMGHSDKKITQQYLTNDILKFNF